MKVWDVLQKSSDQVMRKSKQSSIKILRSHLIFVIHQNKKILKTMETDPSRLERLRGTVGCCVLLRCWLLACRGRFWGHQLSAECQTDPFPSPSPAPAPDPSARSSSWQGDIMRWCFTDTSRYKHSICGHLRPPLLVLMLTKSPDCFNIL